MRNNKYTREFRDLIVQLAINGKQSALKIAANPLRRHLESG